MQQTTHALVAESRKCTQDCEHSSKQRKTCQHLLILSKCLLQMLALYMSHRFTHMSQFISMEPILCLGDMFTWNGKV